MKSPLLYRTNGYHDDNNLVGFTMTGDDLSAALHQLNWSVGELARRLGTNSHTPNRWLRGRIPVPGVVATWLQQCIADPANAPLLPDGWVKHQR